MSQRKPMLPFQALRNVLPKRCAPSEKQPKKAITGIHTGPHVFKRILIRQLSPGLLDMLICWLTSTVRRKILPPFLRKKKLQSTPDTAPSSFASHKSLWTQITTALQFTLPSIYRHKLRRTKKWRYIGVWLYIN
jgi:hypothetical protein